MLLSTLLVVMGGFVVGRRGLGAQGSLEDEARKSHANGWGSITRNGGRSYHANGLLEEHED